MIEFEDGLNENFAWIQVPGSAFGLHDLIQNFPGFLIDKYLAIICFDSGPLKLVPEEKKIGWYEQNGICYSPKLTLQTLNELPYDQYDQWCLFNVSTEVLQVTRFVNYMGFSLTNVEHFGQLIDQFWSELLQADPFNVISNGDNFIFVSKDIRQVESLKNFCH